MNSDQIMEKIAADDAAWFAETPIWYRTGGTLNFKWNVTYSEPTDAAKRRMEESLFRAGYPTIQTVEQPTEFQPAGYRPGKDNP